MNVNNTSIGSLQGDALSMALKFTKADKVFLANNRLTTDAILLILENMNPKIKEINLSDNKITADKDAVQTQQRNLQSKLRIDPELRKLNKYNFKHFYLPSTNRSKSVMTTGNPKTAVSATTAATSAAANALPTAATTAPASATLPTAKPDLKPINKSSNLDLSKVISPEKKKEAEAGAGEKEAGVVEEVEEEEDEAEDDKYKVQVVINKCFLVLAKHLYNQSS